LNPLLAQKSASTGLISSHSKQVYDGPLLPSIFPPIAQLIVEQVMGLPHLNPSQFQGQSTAAGLPGAGPAASG